MSADCSVCMHHNGQQIVRCADYPHTDEPKITLSCRSGDDDCTADCGWCKGTGIEKHPVDALSVARCVAEDFQSFEAHEMPLFHYPRDVEIVLWTLRCLANPLNGWSVPALAAIEEQAGRSAPPADDTRSTAQQRTVPTTPDEKV